MGLFAINVITMSNERDQVTRGIKKFGFATTEWEKTRHITVSYTILRNSTFLQVSRVFLTGLHYVISPFDTLRTVLFVPLSYHPENEFVPPKVRKF